MPLGSDSCSLAGPLHIAPPWHCYLYHSAELPVPAEEEHTPGVTGAADLHWAQLRTTADSLFQEQAAMFQQGLKQSSRNMDLVTFTCLAVSIQALRCFQQSN